MDPKRVNLDQVESIRISYPDQDKFLKGCYVGAGYTSNQGVINLNFVENIEIPADMSEEETEYHIMGVVLVEHFNMKKGMDLFGDRDETAVMKELQKIHDINTYKPMDA